MPSIVIPDMIFDNPTQNDLNPTSLTPTGGRLMASAPHTDGVILFDAYDVAVSATTAPTLTRNGKGDWSLNRTAAAAETLNLRGNLSSQLLRLGEKYYFGLFGQDNKVAAPAKGLQVVDMFAIYTVGVVALTSATLRLGKSVYVNNVALAQTDIVAATTTGATATQANPYVVVVSAGGAAGFMVDDTSEWEMECVIVMANTGTLKFYGMGAHVNLNYN